MGSDPVGGYDIVGEDVGGAGDGVGDVVGDEEVEVVLHRVGDEPTGREELLRHIQRERIFRLWLGAVGLRRRSEGAGLAARCLLGLVAHSGRTRRGVVRCPVRPHRLRRGCCRALSCRLVAVGGVVVHHLVDDVVRARHGWRGPWLVRRKKAPLEKLAAGLRERGEKPPQHLRPTKCMCAKRGPEVKM